MTGDLLLADLRLLAPEVLLAVGAMAFLMVGAYTRAQDGAARIVSLLTLALFLVAALVSIFYVPSEGGTAFQGALIVDDFSRYAKAAVLLAAFISLILAQNYLEQEKLAKFEYPILMALSVLGMTIMVSANDLITMYMGLELQSLALYVLAAFNRDSLRASEAGLKYFVLGALSSGLLLYGASLIYGFSGTTNFAGIAEAVAAEPSLGLMFGMIFLLSGLAFKISAAPFHMWTPDVYEGSPTPVTAFFATAPKLAAMALIARVLMQPFAEMVHDWQQVVMVLSVLSMAVGAFGALTQTNIKRLLAYSSIGNMGFALVGLAAGTSIGLWALLLYLTLYVISVAGSFGIVLSMRRSDGMVERIEDLAGLAQTRPGLGWSMTALMLSIGGLPFFVGFFGKLFVFYAAVSSGLIIFTVIAGLLSVVSMAYYLRVVKVIWFDEPDGSSFLPATFSVNAVVLVTGSATVALLPFMYVMFRFVMQAGSGLG
ncbi:NADH-quinone oxidoreductase subunit NuoN [Woodsholea maritima]|uniref:NADH-quinone oxidoreductase subunit NuoN n=1 Tax=Woodsholea maritima TaxID=240237 RepID=UPI00035F96E3|nr:NADH-quinone oxidoreductase subunit NuoN [Woodsholea maritima]